MAIANVEIGSVWKLKDMLWGPYDKGEPLLHEANYGFYASQEGANRAAQRLEEMYADLPRGSWVVVDEPLYE